MPPVDPRVTTPAPLDDAALQQIEDSLRQAHEVASRMPPMNSVEQLWLRAADALAQLRAQRDEARVIASGRTHFSADTEEVASLRALLAECRDVLWELHSPLNHTMADRGRSCFCPAGRLLTKLDAVLDVRQEPELENLPSKFFIKPSHPSTTPPEFTSPYGGNAATAPVLAAHPSTTPTEGAARHAADVGRVASGAPEPDPSASAPAPSASDVQRAERFARCFPRYVDKRSGDPVFGFEIPLISASREWFIAEVAQQFAEVREEERRARR